ncbi:MAG: hypothetical protein BWK76_13655 [Desulfobulbaceae bacterium A2]|nr:MAG: hypothetical protein BWK76_13655 [Desulfobulbaceae bacterium A2]
MPSAKLVETKCFFHGDPYCEYHLQWARSGLRNWLQRIFAPWKLFRATIEELEQDKKILREKYEEVRSLNTSLSEKITQLLSLQETSTAILSTLKLEILLDLILNRLLQVAHLDRAGIFLLDNQREKLKFIHAVGVDQESIIKLKDYSIPLNKKDNIIARSAREAHPVIIEDVAKMNLNPNNPILKTFNPKAFILVPLKVKEQTVGILVGDNLAGEKSLNKIDKDFLASFANHIAMALENSCLYSKIQRSEQRHRAIVEHSQEGIWLIDEGGTIRFANPLLAKRLGYVRLTGHNLYGLVEEADKKAVLALMREAMNGRSAKGELRLRGSDGATFSVIVSVVPMQAGEVAAEYLLMVTDFTELKQMESRLLQSQKLETIGTMAGGIAHDFNNILTSILGFTQLLKADLADDSSQLRHAEIIEQSSLRAAELVKQLLTFSRGIRPEDAGRISLNEIVTETVQLAERSLPKAIDIALELAGDALPVIGNQTQLQQALLNLLLNARDAMPLGGTISITTRRAEAAELRRRGVAGDVRPGVYAVLGVRDTGSGIPLEHQAKIYDPFFTTKAPGKGTGLGLAMVYGIMRNAHGHIMLDSMPEHGTFFELFFPLTDAAEAEPVHHDAVSGMDGGETVLVVDDEELIRDLAEEMLRAHGYRILKAADGIEALHIMKAFGATIDALLLDLAMPRLDGLQTFEKLRQEGMAPKVLFMSGFTSQVESVVALKEAGHRFLGKPFTETDLLHKLRAVLDQSR